MTNPDTTAEEHLEIAAEYESYLGYPNIHSDAHYQAAQVQRLKTHPSQRYSLNANVSHPKQKSSASMYMKILLGIVILTVIYAIVYISG